MNPSDCAPTTLYTFQANQPVFLAAQKQRELKVAEQLMSQRNDFSFELFDFFAHHGGLTHREIEWLFEKKFDRMMQGDIKFEEYRDSLLKDMKCSKRLSSQAQEELHQLFENAQSLFE